MHTVNTYDLNIVDEHLDVLEHSLRLFMHEKNVITWGEEGDGAFTLVIMPRAVEEVLQEKVFSKKIPYIFSSATLSNNDSFAFTANSLGVKDYLSFSVASPFDYEEQMAVNLLSHTKEDEWERKCQYTLENIQKTNGRTLVLFRTTQELAAFKEYVSKEQMSVPFLYEGIKKLVSSFLVSKMKKRMYFVPFIYGKV